MKNPWDNFTNKTQTTTNPWNSFSQGNVGSSNLSEKEALKYALEMGFTDSFRGIQQMKKTHNFKQYLKMKTMELKLLVFI